MARASRRDFWDVAAVEYWRTYASFIELEEVERIEALEYKDRQFDRARLTALAFHKPEDLKTETDEFIHELKRSNKPLPFSREELTKAALALGQAFRARFSLD